MPYFLIGLLAAGFLGFGLATVFAGLGCLRRSGPGRSRLWLLAALCLVPMLALLLVGGAALVLGELTDPRRLADPVRLAGRVLSPLAGLGLLGFAALVWTLAPAPEP